MNRLTSYRPVIFAVALATLGACNSKPVVEMPATTSAAFTIPELKARPANLGAREFGAISKKVGELQGRLQKNPDDTEALVLLARIYMTEARITGDHPYYYPASEKLLDRALAIDPNYLPAMLAKGSVLLSLHRFADALEIGKRAAAVAPTEATAQGILCDANVELGNYPEAIRAADRMVELRPDLLSYSRVSYLRELHGDDKGSIDAMKLAVQAGVPSYEETAWARFTLGNLLMQKGDTKGAADAYRMAIAERDGYPFALGGLARISAAAGRNDEAIRMLDTASGIMPEYSFVELKAEILRTSGNTAAADSLVEVIEGMLGEDEAAGHRVDLAYSLLYNTHNVRSSEALARAEKEAALRPDNLEAQHAMALSLFRAGRFSEAREWITKALRTGWNRPDLLAHAGLIEAAAGNDAAARTLLARANAHPLSPLLQKEVRKALGAG